MPDSLPRISTVCMLKTIYQIFLVSAGLTTVLFGRADPAKVVGPQNCSACHSGDFAVWQATHHAKAFDILHRVPKAKEIAEKMGVNKIKTQGDCMSCHYTTQGTGKTVRAVSGVSCESCHGGAKDWMSIHPQKNNQARAEGLGWIRPAHTYALYSQCYECHMAPNEKLVNHAGHPAGSPFELVSWSQGSIRHRFYDGATNPPTPQPKIRALYVLGKALELEHALRGVSKATANSTFGQKMALRVKSAYDALETIRKTQPAIPGVDEMLAAVPKKSDGVSLDIRLKREADYLKAADAVKASTQKFLAGADALDLASLDPLIPKETIGKPAK
jgi:hypothetical protein